MLLETAIEKVMGINVHRQLTAVDPLFFDERHVVLKMLSRHQAGQVPALEDLPFRILVSDHPDYMASNTKQHTDIVTLTRRLVREGHNVVVSPFRKRRAPPVTKRLLDEGPYDNLVIVESNDGVTRAFYVHGVKLPNGINMKGGKLTPKQIYDAVCSSYTHFAFVPKEAGVERDLVKLGKGFAFPYRGLIEMSDAPVVDPRKRGGYSAVLKIKGRGKIVEIVYQVKPAQLDREVEGRRRSELNKRIETHVVVYEPLDLSARISVRHFSYGGNGPPLKMYDVENGVLLDGFMPGAVVDVLRKLAPQLEPVRLGENNINYRGLVQVLERAS